MEKYTHRVQYYETDKMGMTHHSNYIRWMEEARVDFMAKTGWDYAVMEKEGIVSPVLAVECEFKTATTFEDVVTIDVSIEEVTPVRMTIGYDMKNEEGKQVCAGYSKHCFLDEEGRPVRMNRRLPGFYDMMKDLSEGGGQNVASVSEK